MTKTKDLCDEVIQLADDLGLDPESVKKKYANNQAPMFKKTVPQGPFYTGNMAAMADQCSGNAPAVGGTGP
jgi:phage terminase small subunit